VAYEAVYLKAHYPLVYMVAVLNAAGGYYQLPEYIEEAKRLGLTILGPDVNRSGYRFEVEGKAIRVGLGSIKNLTTRSLEKSSMSEREMASICRWKIFSDGQNQARATCWL